MRQGAGGIPGTHGGVSDENEAGPSNLYCIFFSFFKFKRQLYYSSIKAFMSIDSVLLFLNSSE